MVAEPEIMDVLGERLLELLHSNGGDNSEDLQQKGTIEISERSTTTLLESADDETHNVSATTSTALQSFGKSIANELPKFLYQEDPTVVAAAAAAAAVKFRSNYLPPIGVFWDIENCQVPKGRSAMAVTRVIRDKFFNGYKEAEFIVVCDVQKENKQIVQELNDAQVDLIHVSATCKNAADEKLRQSIRRFADTHGSPAAIILISGDINFAADLSDLRHRKKIHVILLHKENTSEALILCADEHYDFMKLLQPLPSRTPLKVTTVNTSHMKVSESYDLLVCNLPDDKDVVGIKRRLKQLSNNCGGRVVQVRSNAAVVRFCSKESADRAQKRMHGEFVFDSKISVKYLKEKESCPPKNRGSSGARESTASESEAVNESTNEMYGVASAITGARSLPGTPHYPTSSPVVGNYYNWNGSYCVPQGCAMPAPIFVRPYPPNEVNRHTRSQSPQVWQMSGSQQQSHRHWDERCKGRDYAAAEQSNFRSGKAGQRNNIFPQQPPDWNPPRPPWPVSNNHNGSVYNQTHKRRSPSPLYASQNQEASHWNGLNHNTSSKRSDRTPSPYSLNASMLGSGQRVERMSPYRQSDAESEEVENFFNPINNQNSNGIANRAYTPIELQVTNLDQNIDLKDMKRIISSVFMEHVMVLQVSIFVQSDGNPIAIVKVPSLPEAQYAISQLHRRKIGYKRIRISYGHTGGPNPQIIRSQIVMLLQEVPGHKLPLFKFREMYESRFLISISISELHKMKDVCVITDDPSGRMVALNPDHRNTPSPCLNTTLDGQNLELPYCTIHAQKPWTDKGWAEQEMASLPDIKISLKLLTERVHKLLTTHSGNLPLPSFPSCYEAEFNESLHVDDNGVPLEHLVSCIPTIELKQGIGSVKHITWSSNKNHDESHENTYSIISGDNKCVSPPLANQLALFSRELVDLLKTAPHCQLSFNRFIPVYHHHFGRQCRVADYGFTKLIDLLEALDNTVQVMGEGNKRVVTLSHRAQVRRFTSDLLRVLKALASKQVTLSEFPSVYSRVIGKSWDVTDYGVCELDDILGEVSENTVMVTSINNDSDRLIAIPKREQTLLEIERTRKFATEVIELLKHAPQQRMLFNKFVPSYHHHFGHQCRVSNYGFTKLIELFEAIPDIVKIEEVEGGERRISLTEKEGIRVLGEQITKLIGHFGNTYGQLMVSNVAQTFLQEFGYALRPELFTCNSMLQLMEKLEGIVKVVNTRNGVAVVSIDKGEVQQLALECRRILMDAPNHCLPVSKFNQFYEQMYVKKCAIEKYTDNLENYINVFTLNNELYVKLSPLQEFACNVQRVLIQHNGKINFSQFEAAYLKVIGTACRSTQYGYPTLYTLLRALPCTITLKDVRHRRKVVQLNRKLALIGLIPSSYATSASPNQDTDSSNDSIETDFMSSLSANQVNNSSMSNDLCKWDSASKQFSRNDESTGWDKKSSHWALSGQDNPQKWLALENKNNESGFFESLEKVASTFPPPPPKPDSPEDADSKDKSWRSSIWSTPPNSKQGYNQEPNYLNVEMPPFTLSPLKNMNNYDSSKLVSPAKYLLPACPNPLEPRISPYFGNSRKPVVAPHPSKLPLPSLSFTPKKNTAQQDESRKSTAAELSQSPVSSKHDASANNEGIDRINDTTPSKRSFFGKCRLAAQFNQPPFD